MNDFVSSGEHILSLLVDCSFAKGSTLAGLQHLRWSVSLRDFRVAVVRSRPVPEDNTAVTLGEPSTDLPNDDAFRGQWIKFERVLSHLANERTWLAWLRVALTLLAAAFTLW